MSVKLKTIILNKHGKYLVLNSYDSTQNVTSVTQRIQISTFEDAEPIVDADRYLQCRQKSAKQFHNNFCRHKKKGASNIF